MRVSFTYPSRNGGARGRTIDMDSVEWVANPNPDWFLQPGWFISGFDHEKQGRRSYALNKIVLPDHIVTPKGSYGYFRLFNMPERS